MLSYAYRSSYISYDRKIVASSAGFLELAIERKLRVKNQYYNEYIFQVYLTIVSSIIKKLQ
jgi:hypothetical protein